MAFRISRMTMLRLTDYKTFANRMKDAIKQHDGHVDKVATAIGVGNTTVKRWLNQDPKLLKFALKSGRTSRSDMSKKRQLDYTEFVKSMKIYIRLHKGCVSDIADDIGVTPRTATRWINRDEILNAYAVGVRFPTKRKVA